MTRKKKYPKILNVPVSDTIHRQVNEKADKESRSGASVVREIIEKEFKHRSFREDIIEK